jgi:hypothetical protein
VVARDRRKRKASRVVGERLRDALGPVYVRGYQRLRDVSERSVPRQVPGHPLSAVRVGRGQRFRDRRDRFELRGLFCDGLRDLLRAVRVGGRQRFRHLLEREGLP